MDLKNYTQVARDLNVNHATIRDLVRTHGLHPKRPPGVSGPFKGLDSRDIRVLKRALNMVGAS